MKFFQSALVCIAMMATCRLAPAAVVPVPQADETAAIYKRLGEQIGPSLVTVKYILKIEGGGALGGMMGDDEGREAEVTGLMIEADGLVLCSNTKMGGFMAMMSAMRGGGINANPTEIKVLSGDDTEGLKAKVLARDTDRDLCWIKIDDEKAKGKTFPFLDLKAAAPASLGDKLYAVQREGKFFDHALVVSEGRVGGKARKPRALIIPSGLGLDLGMPAVNGEGKLLGIAVLQVPSREDSEGGDMGGMFDGLGGGMGMLLPADEVAKATERGKEVAASTSAAPSTPTDKAETKTEEKK